MLPLHFACGPHGEAIVPMLLQYSPEWQVVQMSAWDQIPLIHACYHGSIGVVRLLLQYQPEHQMDLGPQRPLDIAVETGHLALAMELLNHEAVLRFLPNSSSDWSSLLRDPEGESLFVSLLMNGHISEKDLDVLIGNEEILCHLKARVVALRSAKSARSVTH